MKAFKWYHGFLLAALVVFAAASLLHQQLYRHQTNYDDLRAQAEQNLQAEEIRINSFLDKVSENFGLGNEFTLAHVRYLNTITESIDGFSFFVFYEDSLRYWSSNNEFFKLEDIAQTGNQQTIRLGNGIFELFKRRAGDKLLVALFRIQNDYPIENEYLNNNFHPRLGLSHRARISPVKNERIFPVRSQTGEVLFSLSFTPISDDTEQFEGEQHVGLLYIIAIALFMVFAFVVTRRLLRRRPLLGLLAVAGIIFLRLAGIVYRVPGSMYELPLFSPKYYASSFMLYSLGDLLISSVVFCYIITSLYTYYEEKGRPGQSAGGKIGGSAHVVLIWLFTFLFSVLINYLLSSLIINSKISFNINNIFELTGFSIIGFLVIGFLLFSFYLVCDGGIRFIISKQFRFLELAALFLLTQGLFLVVLILFRDTVLFRNYGISAFLLANLLILFIGWVRGQTGRAYSFTRSILFILGFSFYAAQTIFDFNGRRTQENMKALVSRLENAQDAIAEFLFDEIVSKARNDAYLVSYFSSSYEQLISTIADEDVLHRRMMETYFTGYWNKYDVRIKTFTGTGLPVNTGGDPSWNLDYYDKLIATAGKPTYSPGFYLLGDQAGRITYLGKINIPSPVLPDSVIGTMIVELNSRLLDEDQGYPDLLLSSKLSAYRNVSNFSYARYKDNELLNQHGNFDYDLTPVLYDRYIDLAKSEQLIKFNDWQHLFYRSDKENLIIVSTRPQGALGLITLFSYIFSFFCLAFILITASVRLSQSRFRLRVNFKSRVQGTIIAIVVASMVIIGASTVTYIVNNYSSTQQLKLRERLESMLNAIDRDISDYRTFGNEVSAELSAKFLHLYQTVDVDFNIYNEAGHLAYTTQPKLFEQNIIAPLMDSKVYRQFVFNNVSNTVNFEHIGTLGYMTGYAAIRNEENKVIGYLNLPYFARTSELKKEISSFLVALINIYVLLFAVAVALTFIISTRITNPLRIIQDRMSKVKLGKRNERIEWHADDEIGALIDEYNRMIDELADSAQRLARSERETAWREMAKQVAHEIKNPLTPMKLSVQHLQRAWKDKTGNMEEIMQRFSNTLVEQIDTLSSIATEFSNFAKMPGATFAPVNISEALKNSVTLYGKSGHVTVKQYDFTNGKIEVYADKDQLVRVFSNLLKNAIQAIPPEREGEVLAKITHDENNCMISISDNGDGIPEDKIEKIFTPNFTTKSGGTGLGLAMVKNIIENSKGNIWFETESGRGTTFYITLPIFKGMNQP